MTKHFDGEYQLAPQTKTDATDVIETNFNGRTIDELTTDLKDKVVGWTDKGLDRRATITATHDPFGTIPEYYVPSGGIENPQVEELPAIDYKFRENELIAEFKAYIDSTYQGHYAQNKLQSAEVIIDRGHGLGFFQGNVDKYNARYGLKGSAADYRKDMVKVLHYALLTLYEHDRIHSDKD
jgi:hypothetical protein|tara:strand:+ start:3140 stop:3682 length:543 start_codon:yes stop_codon:yes gene_type:complete